MNIVFISKLTGTSASGPNWSVPARIKAQAHYDNIFWVNLDDSVMPHWIETGLYHSLKDIGGKLRLKYLPPDFSIPDIVVFEVPYFVEYLGFAAELRRRKIPYIIVPRCGFTHHALNNHAKWKKKIAGWLFFNRFFKGASAIQYLTRQEKEDSTKFLSIKNFIIPNGINLPTKQNYQRESNKITGIFIGRIDIYHKGLDILLEAVITISEFLRNNNVAFDIYGPKNRDYEKLQRKAVLSKVDDIFLLKDNIEGTDKELALRNADFFIMTSRFEGLPMAMLEALSYSLPCIASDGTYLRNEIESFDAGVGCSGTPEDVGQAIIHLVSNISSLQRYRNNAYRLASKYKWEEQARLFHLHVDKILKTYQD